jgi:hypothetical protein
MVTIPRSAFAGTLAAAVMMVSLGVAVPTSGATTLRYASPSAFCTTIYSFHGTAPTGTNYNAYPKWAKTNLSFYKKLASQAPNAKTKKVLNELVTILKYEAKQKNLKTLGKYIAKNQKQWSNGWKAFAGAVLSCAKSLA